MDEFVSHLFPVHRHLQLAESKFAAQQHRHASEQSHSGATALFRLELLHLDGDLVNLRQRFFALALGLPDPRHGLGERFVHFRERLGVTRQRLGVRPPRERLPTNLSQAVFVSGPSGKFQGGA